MQLSDVSRNSPHSTTGKFIDVTALYFAILTTVLFGRLLWHANEVISTPGTDGQTYFYPVRQFAFEQLRAGHLPLWNPYTMGGIPALGNFQYAILYPINWLHLILPTGLAMNWIAAIHVFLAGMFTAAWCRYRCCGIIASLLAGTLFIFSGQFATHVGGGSFAFVNAMTWMPLIFLCVDSILDRHLCRIACLIGGAAVAMQILAGYPQLVYITFLATCCYVISGLINHHRWLHSIGWVLGMYILGAGLSAAQLLPGITATAESVRGGELNYGLAASFSLPAENLLTLVAPTPFGDGIHAPTFGRWGNGETSLFIGAVGLTLAAIGISVSAKSRDIALLVTLVLIFLLALGGGNPSYWLLIRVIPALNHFRAPARFATILQLLMVLLAARGFDHLFRSRRTRVWMIATVSAAILLLLAGMLVHRSAAAGFEGLWGTVLTKMTQTNQTWDQLTQPEQINQSAKWAAHEFFLAGGSFAGISIILLLVHRSGRWVYLLPLVAFFDCAAQFSMMRQHFQPVIERPAYWSAAEQQIKGDARILTLVGGEQNLPMQFHREAIGGYDPMVLARWDAFVAPLITADTGTGNLQTFRIKPSPRWLLLRFGGTIPSVEPVADDPLPRLSLMTDYVIASSPDESLLAVRKIGFDPRKTIVLEQQPEPKPQSSDSVDFQGKTRLARISNDELEIEAELNHPAVLLVTDGYSAGWRAISIEPGPQATYQVLPADHAFRAIPLAAGKHHLLLEYRPVTVPIGFSISGLTLLGYAIAWGVSLRTKQHDSNRRG